MTTPEKSPEPEPPLTSDERPAPARNGGGGGENLLPFLAALSAVAGLAELAFVIVNVSALPVYLKSGLGLPNLPGIALAAFYTAEAIGNSPMGALADRFGRRRIMVFGALLSVLTCVGTAFVRVPQGPGAVIWGAVGLILLFRVLDGLGAAMLWPAVFASVGDRVPIQRQAQAMSALNITYLVGIALGPLIGGLVNDTLGGAYGVADPRRYAPSFFVAAGCFFLTAVIAYVAAPRRAEKPLPVQQRIAEEEGETTVGEIAEAAHPPVALAAIKKALRTVPMLMILGFLIFFGVGLIAPYAKTFFMARYNLSESAFGSLLLVPALIIAVISLPLGRLADAWGKTRSIHLGMGVCALSLWMIIFLKSQVAVIALGTLLGIGFVLAFPSYMAYLAEIAGPEERGGLIGAVRMAQGFGALLGAALASPLYTLDAEHLTIFVIAAGMLTLGFVLSLFFVKERPRPEGAAAA
jgi:DHA1 family multidrug resistance protein-like MFS transporter